MFYESIYQKKDETEPDKYAESNYGGDNSTLKYISIQTVRSK